MVLGPGLGQAVVNAVHGQAERRAAVVERSFAPTRCTCDGSLFAVKCLGNRGRRSMTALQGFPARSQGRCPARLASPGHSSRVMRARRWMPKPTAVSPAPPSHPTNDTPTSGLLAHSCCAHEPATTSDSASPDMAGPSYRASIHLDGSRTRPISLLYPTRT